MKYLTRRRIKRFYEWRGKRLSFNRKLKTYEYGSLVIRTEGVPGTTVITPGQHILIEGEDDDNPYVARVLQLFGDENQEQKKALVQWFVRFSELPYSKRTLLGREPHPKEIFFYQGPSCENEVDAESILRAVQVKHVDSAAPIPDSDSEETFYVKLSWDSRRFSVVDSAVLQTADQRCPPLTRIEPSLPPSPPRSPPAATPTSRAPSQRSLPTPDPEVIRRAATAELRISRASASAGKAAFVEVESIHSATKLSASKCLSAKRREMSSRTPGVRKKLDLSSPEKSKEDFLNQLLDEELNSGVKLDRLSSSSSLPVSSALSCSLTPLRSARKSRAAEGARHLKLTPVRLSRRSSMEDDSPSHTSRASTPSRKKEVKSVKEPALGVLPEADCESSPKLPDGATPRSSKRKSAMMVSSRIRKQLNLLNGQNDPDSDGDDEDEFAPSKKELQSSSEEEEEDVEGVDELDSDEEVLKKKKRRPSTAPQTPRSRQKPRPSTRTPRKTPSRKSPPSTPRTPRHATPSIPSRLLPTRQPANVLEEARIRLHVSAVPESLPCREQEFQDIYSFVESKILDGTGGCMYISGVPGTGKTATVHEVMRCLQHAADMDEISPFHFIEINGMKMTDPHQAYVQILQKLTGQKATADHAAALLEKRFSNPAPRKETTVLLVDELDLLWTRKQNVMYNLFDWPSRRHARLVVLAIANTMDLPERIMINRVASRLGLTRMSFQPYTFKQLQQIITSRLNKVKAFEEDALQLVSRKVAALSGDARRCLDICRRATEICEHSAADSSDAGLVAMSHVMEALNEMFSSAYITAIKCASLQEQLFLRAVIAEFRRLGLEEATFQQVLVQHQALCRVEGLQPIGVSESLAVCQRLGACRLLLLEHSRLGVLQRVRLNVSQDDVLYALKAD
ncbi:origin recognition complex subunit 1 [Oryzias melastigma]|uniref:Origin recognition complex subunit 1 n=1 Tax=Oryzias melastigma TaxID=30732 RepID=A0A3B3CCN4_ORYME|nr:origin recognition complex subunit 1 [Oryzias melastigma]